MTQLSLAGKWERRIDSKPIDHVSVPGGYPLVGQCALRRTFKADKTFTEDTTRRLFLCTEGVLVKADFSINGMNIGTAGPWVPYQFGVPAGLLKEENTIEVHVTDILEPFGPAMGRHMEAGLVRDIYLESRPACHIETVLFSYQLSDDMRRAECKVQTTLSGSSQAGLTVELLDQDNNNVVATTFVQGQETTEFIVEQPRLWSPDTPSLYTLKVRTNETETDEYSDIVGFRSIAIDDHDFFVNGQRTILKGVCRHEFMSGYGYSPPEKKVRQELTLIKKSGFNYVRLVHSPHARCVPRIAAELGLLVSEEPGTCFNDLSDANIAEPALDCLKRMVLRDRNLPSILAWFIYNECNPNTAYAKRASQLCRTLHPECLLSFGDCSGRDDEIRTMMKEARLSFAGINVYSFNIEDYTRRMDAFNDCPIVFTEWGGFLYQGNERLLRTLCGAFAEHSQPSATQRMAGSSFWIWADYPEATRPEPSTIDGWTVEGLLDKNRNPKPDLRIMSDMFDQVDRPRLPAQPAVEILLTGDTRPGKWECIDLESVEGDQSALEEEIAAMRKDYPHQHPLIGSLEVDGIRFQCRDHAQLKYPLLLGRNRRELLIPVSKTVRRIAVLGHVALKGGYPATDVWSVHRGTCELLKELGQPASTYHFETGSEIIKEPLRHGKEILRANNICRAWRTSPQAAGTTSAVQIMVNTSFEILRLDLWEKEFDTPIDLSSIKWMLDDTDSIQAIYAISIMKA